MATDAEKAAFKRRTGEDWSIPLVSNIHEITPADWSPPPPEPNSEKLDPAMVASWGKPVPTPAKPNANSFEDITPDMGLPTAATVNTPSSLYGRGKLTELLYGRAPSFAGKPHSQDWDMWLLTLPFDKGDTAYNDAMAVERMQAIERQRARGFDVSGFKATGGPEDKARSGRIRDSQASNTQDAADIKELKGRAATAAKQVQLNEQFPNLIYNANGQLIDPVQATGGKGGVTPPRDPSQASGDYAAGAAGKVTGGSQLDGLLDAGSGDLLDGSPTSGSGDPAAPPGTPTTVAATPMTSAQLRASGKMVWLGKEPKTVRFNGKDYVVQQDKFTTVDDALFSIGKHDFTFTVGDQKLDITGFQKMLGLAETGQADKDTRAAWSQVVDTANYYTTIGEPMDFGTAAVAMASAANGSRGSGGGGAKVPADQAHLLLNQVTKQLTGREATGAEFNSFLAGIKGAAGSQDFDATQYAQDWVKGRLGQQVGSYQAGTDYYNVVQQLIGGA